MSYAGSSARSRFLRTERSRSLRAAERNQGRFARNLALASREAFAVSNMVMELIF